MRVLIINSVCGTGSTGRICTDLACELERNGHEVKIAYGRGSVPKQFRKYAFQICSRWDVYRHVFLSLFFDRSGFGSRNSTIRFVKWIKQYNPDVIHLHNLHGYYLNIEVLFCFIKTFKGKVIWTLHDCWPFTGHCAYFDFAKCNEWQCGCKDCVQTNDYPKSLFISRSRSNYLRKEKAFTNVPNLTLVTPSKWLANLVKQSFLREYPVYVVHNGIDTQIFKPTKSHILSRYHLEGKTVVLGVASFWSSRKGLKYFIQLADMLPEQYRVVLIGLSQKQIASLPPKIVGIQKTNDVHELVEWYSAAEVFVNPTLEDNYPTTNIEAQACGTPVITFNTGGSVESADCYGTSVEKGDLEAIIRYITEGNYEHKNFDHTIQGMLNQYIELIT